MVEDHGSKDERERGRGEGGESLKGKGERRGSRDFVRKVLVLSFLMKIFQHMGGIINSLGEEKG